jgi:hypothetical protein
LVQLPHYTNEIKMNRIEYKEIDELNQQEIIRTFDLDESKYPDYLMFQNNAALKDFLEHSKQNNLAIEIGEPIINPIIQES